MICRSVIKNLVGTIRTQVHGNHWAICAANIKIFNITWYYWYAGELDCWDGTDEPRLSDGDTDCQIATRNGGHYGPNQVSYDWSTDHHFCWLWPAYLTLEPHSGVRLDPRWCYPLIILLSNACNMGCQISYGFMLSKSMTALGSKSTPGCE